MPIRIHNNAKITNRTDEDGVPFLVVHPWDISASEVAYSLEVAKAIGDAARDIEQRMKDR